MEFNLKYKKAIITGATKGIGKAIAIALANEGCNIAYFGRNNDAVDDLKTKLIDLEVDSLGGPIDVDKDFEFVDFIEKIKYYWGDIDIIINNVGGGGSYDHRDVFDRNVEPMVQLTNAFLDGMKKREWGRIISISSIYGKEASSSSSWFSMAKASQISYMKSMSQKKEYVRNGITFNTISPGHISCGHNYEKNRGTYEFKSMINKMPMGKLGKPEDVANTVAFLCSGQAKHINGANIIIDGGESKSL